MKALKIIAAGLLLATASAYAAEAPVTVSAPKTTVSAAAESGSVASASLDVQGAPTIVSSTPTSITLQWNKVEAAVSYIVMYSTKSVATSADPNLVYDNETAPVSETGTTVDKLNENGTYYFAVVALDKDGNQSEAYSDELMVKLGTNSGEPAAQAPANGEVAAQAPANGEATAAAQNDASFALNSVNTKDSRTLVLEFSADVGTDPVQAKLQKTQNSATVEVIKAEVDPQNAKNVILTLGSDLESESSYSLTIVSAKDSKGNNIPEGINAIKEFTTLANLPKAEAAAETPEVSLDAAGSGAAVSGADLTKAETGAKENVLMILALVSGLGIVFALRKKAA